MKRNLTVWMSLGVAGLAPLGCEWTSETTRVEAGSRDSASIAVVDNVEPLWADSGDAWLIEPQPQLSIGVAEGAPEYQLFRVRHALRLSNGNILVADGGSRQLRIFDRDGVHVRSVGGDGEGPGELRVISVLARYGTDSVATYDGQLERISIWGQDGTFTRSFRQPDVGRFIYVRGFFRDGSLVGSADQGVNFDTLSTGVLKARSLLFRLTPAGEVHSIGDFFSTESYVKIGERQSVSSMPFARRAVYATDGDSLHYGTSERYEIQTFTSRGELVRIIRLPRSSAPITEQLIDGYLEGAAARFDDPGARREFVATVREMPHSETLPAYSELLVDEDRNLWVADYYPPGEATRSWTVFDPQGRLLGRVGQPPGLRITDIGTDYVLGVSRDEFGVERVVKHRIMK